ncbi:VanW family protein [Oceanobacillus polygoni]|uniref:Vancomycin resistance protein YoaR n=1 Tax=Oceanobacillus polygoni TaxID=1235259 RepID=A0A9X1CCF0_9BACI|nr:VanW family protein [Oceanobacillus polygoni]MBP2077966.1 vancomycin resistance protein YoaR [Oceanobacillus polygoni]
MRFFLCALLLIGTPLHAQASSVQLNNKEITLKKVEIEQYGLDVIDASFIDDNKLNKLMDSLEAEIYQEPQNAFYQKDGGISAEKLGVTLDRDKFEYLFRKLYYSDKDGKLHVPVNPVYPEVDVGLLKEISSKVLGGYTTYYNPRNSERSDNIALAAEAVNNTVIFPGDTFSFNQVVGERTVGRGYKKAPVIVKGELAEDIGGGICQVSSTLFNAVDLKGIQIMERYAHSRRVPYVPPGRDATVSWWGPDFVFKNLYNEPILIRASSKNGKMIVSIYSSETVEYFNGRVD